MGNSNEFRPFNLKMGSDIRSFDLIDLIIEDTQLVEAYNDKNLQFPVRSPKLK